MSKKVGQIVKNEPAFPNAEAVKIETLIGKAMKIQAFCQRQGEKGNFLVISAEVNGNLISFSCGGKVIVDKLAKIADYYKVDAEGEQKIWNLPESVEGMIIETKNKEGRIYYDFVDSD